VASTFQAVKDGKQIVSYLLKCDEIDRHFEIFPDGDASFRVEEHYERPQHGSEKTGGTEEGRGGPGGEETPPAIPAAAGAEGTDSEDRVILGLHFKR
jgi:hypothetical protein